MSYRQYRDFERGEQILIAVDTCSGGGDRTVAQFMSRKKIDIPLVYHSKVTTSEYIPLLVRSMEYLNDITGVRPVIALERNNGGAFLTDRLAQLNYMGKYEMFQMPMFGTIDSRLSDTHKYGWDTSSATRPKMLAEAKGLIDKQVVRIYDKPTITELFSFVVNQRNNSWKAQAENGAKDDLVMALCIVFQMYLLGKGAQSDTTQYGLMKKVPKRKLFTNGYY
jgi:hypothetical protein